MKAPEWRRSGIFIANFEQISKDFSEHFIAFSKRLEKNIKKSERSFY